MLHLPHPPTLRTIAMIAAVCVLGFSTDRSASAQGLGVYGFQPYGFYQPYGVRYRSSVATPPYFALNPPVYYGTRYFRPYGISPFAAPPQVSAPAGYQGQVGPSGPRSQHYQGPVSNPFICTSCDTGVATQADTVASNGAPDTGSNSNLGTLTASKPFVPGKVQTNPFVEQEPHFAKR